MGRKKKKEIRATQVRYNKKVPTKSFRLDPGTIEKLNTLREDSKSKTWAELFKVLVGEVEIELMSIEEAKRAGCEIGVRNARLRYAVSFPCADCGQTIFINGPELISQVRKLIVETGWAHTECPKPHFIPPTSPKPNPANMSRPNPNPLIMPGEKSDNQDKISHFIKG
jgi:hypothetical protein